MAMLCYCLCVLKIASFVVFSVLWIKLPSVWGFLLIYLILTFIQTFTFVLAELFRSSSLLLNLVASLGVLVLFCFFLIGLVVEKSKCWYC